MSCGVDRRRCSDPALLCLWRRPVAAGLIGPLAWEPPYAKGVALEKTKKGRREGRKEGRKKEGKKENDTNQDVSRVPKREGDWEGGRAQCGLLSPVLRLHRPEGRPCPSMCASEGGCGGQALTPFSAGATEARGSKKVIPLQGAVDPP